MKHFYRPMKAAPLLSKNADYSDAGILAAMEKLRYPVLATIKYDGIRAIRLNGTLLSIRRKPIPNKLLCERAMILPGGYDMELCSEILQYHEVESIVMSREHPDTDKVRFQLLDIVSDKPYNRRINDIHEFMTSGMDLPFVRFCPPVICHSATDLFEYFLRLENEGYEGVCFRLPDSPYKQGKSTLNEQYLIKLCRYKRSEARIIGFVEQMSNENEDNHNNVGYMDRSSAKDNLVPKDTLGALIVQDVVTGCTFKIGSMDGITGERRKYIWKYQWEFKGKQIMYKYKPHGTKDKPRSPVMLGFREEGY